MWERIKTWWRRVVHGWSVRDVANVVSCPHEAASLIWKKVPFDQNKNGSHYDDCATYEELLKELFDIKGWTGYELQMISLEPTSIIEDEEATYKTYSGHVAWCWYDDYVLYYADNVTRGSIKVKDNAEIFHRCQKWLSYKAKVSGVKWYGRNTWHYAENSGGT